MSTGFYPLGGGGGGGGEGNRHQHDRTLSPFIESIIYTPSLGEKAKIDALGIVPGEIPI